jgi:UDP-glucose 4-epimerase
MRIVLTGSSGRIGRAIFTALAPHHEVAGIDRKPSATTTIVGDFADRDLVARALDGADAVIHTAAFHAPHVGVVADREFERVNVEGTQQLAELCASTGIRRLVFTSTTALFGNAIAAGRCTWVDENLTPQPKSIYHRTKLAAENLLVQMASASLQIRALRMSRCFPEAADSMAIYRDSSFRQRRPSRRPIASYWPLMRQQFFASACPAWCGFSSSEHGPCQPPSTVSTPPLRPSGS